MQTVLDETKLRNPKNGLELSTLRFRRKREREEFDKFLPLFFNLTSFICFKKKGLFSQWKKSQQSSFAKWIPSSIWQNNIDAVSEKPLCEMSAFLTSTFRLFHQLSVTPWCLRHYTSTHLHLAQAFPVPIPMNRGFPGTTGNPWQLPICWCNAPLGWCSSKQSQRPMCSLRKAATCPHDQHWHLLGSSFSVVSHGFKLSLNNIVPVPVKK